MLFHQSLGGLYEEVAAEVIVQALRSAAAEYTAAADAAAARVVIDDDGVTPGAETSLDEWHEAVLRQEHALALLQRAARPSMGCIKAQPGADGFLVSALTEASSSARRLKSPPGREGSLSSPSGHLPRACPRALEVTPTQMTKENH